MSAEQEPPRSSLADPTRDIRLPPLPGTVRPSVPPEWEGALPRRVTEPDAGVRADEPTDAVTSPRPVDRDPTLRFEGSARERWAAGHAATPDPAWSSVPAPGPVVTPRARPRRWPWIVLTLVPVVVILGAGLWLLLLLR